MYFLLYSKSFVVVVVVWGGGGELSKPMMSTLASLNLPFQLLPCFSSRVGYGVVSPSKSLSWISPRKFERNLLAMAVKLFSLPLYTRYGS